MFGWLSEVTIGGRSANGRPRDARVSRTLMATEGSAASICPICPNAWAQAREAAFDKGVGWAMSAGS